MARLTKRDELSGMGVLVLEEERLLSSKGFVDKDEMYKIMMHLAEKLVDYEDAEENGMLLKLPCKVGDTVYRIIDHGRLMDVCKEAEDCYSCSGICPYEGRESERVYEIDSLKMTSTAVIANVMEHLGKTVFLSKEEAEAMVATLKNQKR